MAKSAKETSTFWDGVYATLLDKFRDELGKDLKGYYVWPFPLDSLCETLDSLCETELTECKIKKELEDYKDDPAKLTLEAKSRVSEFLLLSKKQDYLRIAEWIVGKWGKINSVPKDDSLTELRETIEAKNDPNKYADVIGFDGISSLSKVASFLDCAKYPVYDSRVAFTLNWLIFTERWHEKDNGEMKFFRQPAARNGDMDIHDQETIFNLAYENFAVGNEFYYPPRETYERYCQLLKGTCDYSKRPQSNYTSNNPGNKEISIGELEMCLFSIAARNKKNKLPCNYDSAEKGTNKYITDEMDEILKPAFQKFRRSRTMRSGCGRIVLRSTAR